MEWKKGISRLSNFFFWKKGGEYRIVRRSFEKAENYFCEGRAVVSVGMCVVLVKWYV